MFFYLILFSPPRAYPSEEYSVPPPPPTHIVWAAPHTLCGASRDTHPHHDMMLIVFFGKTINPSPSPTFYI